MPGNEVQIARYLIANIGRISLPHLGVIRSVGTPRRGPSYTLITDVHDANKISSPDATKKADIYLNSIGVSLKQTGGSFAFNRIQRANIQDLFRQLKFPNIDFKLQRLDIEVKRFHEGLLERRNRPWRDLFNEEDFKTLLNFLMMKGSPNLGISDHQAELILEASMETTSTRMSVYSFEEYFSKYKGKFKVAIRRQWIGQASNSEHSRAISLARKPGNAPWVFRNIVGSPTSGWRGGFPLNLRKTVYFLMIEKER